MTITISLEEAQAKLKDLVHQLSPGDEIVILENQLPVATLTGKTSPARKPRVPGNCKGMISLLVEDDEHLVGFEDYMR
jgi:antitoxin (DNA-binding transcriptional repressor) of toxin-antitoxin stability system